MRYIYIYIYHIIIVISYFSKDFADEFPRIAVKSRVAKLRPSATRRSPTRQVLTSSTDVASFMMVVDGL